MPALFCPFWTEVLPRPHRITGKPLPVRRKELPAISQNEKFFRRGQPFGAGFSHDPELLIKHCAHRLRFLTVPGMNGGKAGEYEEVLDCIRSITGLHLSIMDTVLLTGANRGLGREFTRQLVQRGARVVATCRRPRAATSLQALAEAHPDRVLPIRLDVADPASIDDAIRWLEAHVEQIDLLINNAGIHGGGGTDRWGALDQETLIRVFRVNAAGPALLVQRATALLAAAEDRTHPPTVVNVTSQLGSIAEVSGRAAWYSYRASKAALNMLTRLMAFELKHKGIIAVALHPGWVQTDMGGPHADLTPAESVAGMLAVIESLTPDDSGTLRTWDGGTLPW